jgi:lysophospholipase L1-like esterase
MSKGKKAVFWVVLGAIILSPIVVAELVLRHVGLGNPVLYQTARSYRFAPRPNQSLVRQGGARVTIDSQGLRSTKDWASPAHGKLLFIGDSVTWGGTHIDDGDTFAAGVCARLEAATGNRFVCGNGGVNEYGLDNMAARIRFKTVQDESALVITLISEDALRGLRDADGAFVFERQPAGPFKALWEASAFLVWRLNRAMRPIDPLRGFEDYRVADLSFRNLFNAIRETDRPGRKVLFVISPLVAELHGRETGLTKMVQAAIERSGFPFLDLHEAVSAAVTPDFHYDGVHLDRRGHQFYADQIARRLLAEMGEPKGQ